MPVFYVLGAGYFLFLVGGVVAVGAAVAMLLMRGEKATELTLGALTTHNDVLNSPAFRRDALPLVQACAEVGAPQIRARGTIAGNLVTASPANDTITALYVLDAEVEVASSNGRRRIGVEQFCTGFRTTAMRSDELIRSISVRKLDAQRRGIFLKLGLRRAQAISVINVAIVASFDGPRVRDARIALGCVAPTIVRVADAEASLAGSTLDRAAQILAGHRLLKEFRRQRRSGQQIR